ncbi:hypothetical protein AsFPU1_2858 [Aphanothece sacrum FPU1]|uniref:Uncharacterized protein n=1 Tax=Aphanothece sacrum FPU1 TaxID=1920663 RepID=A0A401IJF7_APHSA|nr:hypothetical protein AsFPU1_2858 [Aphanothece sacrum FPU1]GBF85576.1 hypothetical protein AsFPU3_2638 [Aphanothece sacrum FPU3]
MVKKVKVIQFVVDEKGEKKAVLIDLNEWGELWEDFYDIAVSRARKNELEISWEDLKAEIEQESKTDK